MQREIKFRGQRADTKEWVYGWYREWVMDGILKSHGYRDGINYYIDNRITNESYLVIPETVGQYTGLIDLDCNGIYEGDIIQHLHEYSSAGDMYIVEWDDDIESVIGGYIFRGIKGGNIAVCDTGDDYSGEYAIRVIGNIYDNPELLK